MKERFAFLRRKPEGSLAMGDAALEGVVVFAEDRFAGRSDEMTPGASVQEAMTDEELVRARANFVGTREAIEFRKEFRRKLTPTQYARLFRTLAREERKAELMAAFEHHFQYRGGLSERQTLKGSAFIDWINNGGDIDQIAERYDIPPDEARYVGYSMPFYASQLIAARRQAQITPPVEKVAAEPELGQLIEFPYIDHSSNAL